MRTKISTPQILRRAVWVLYETSKKFVALVWCETKKVRLKKRKIIVKMNQLRNRYFSFRRGSTRSRLVLERENGQRLVRRRAVTDCDVGRKNTKRFRKCGVPKPKVKKKQKFVDTRHGKNTANWAFEKCALLVRRCHGDQPLEVFRLCRSGGGRDLRSVNHSKKKKVLSTFSNVNGNSSYESSRVGSYAFSYEMRDKTAILKTRPDAFR